jgi:hypothetical protein
MKRFLAWVVAGMFSVPAYGMYKRFRQKYDFGLYYINLEEEAKEQEEFNSAQEKARKLFLRPADYTHAMDLRGTPTHVCACGCDIWNLKVAFDDYQIANYFLDMECANCGSIATAPTPIDKEAN